MSALIDCEHAETSWKAYWTQAYYGTVVFAFICCAFYMIFFLCLLVFQGTVDARFCSTTASHWSC
jgi:hypothetical protein